MHPIWCHCGLLQNNNVEICIKDNIVRLFIYMVVLKQKRGEDVFTGDFQSLRFLVILLLLRSIKSSIIVIKSSSSSLPYFFRAYSRNSGHSTGDESVTGGKWPTMTSAFSTGSPAYSAKVRQDCGLGLSLPDSHRLTVA